MILKSIEAVGLKGPDFSYQLADATAIIGANAAGKTRILQAIRLVLGGYLPECGKTARASWELASGPEMRVVAEFSGGPSIMRRFWLEGDKVQAEAIMSHGTDKINPTTLRDLPLLNDSAYFELTDNPRTEYVFERIKLPDIYTPASIVAECQRLSFEEEHTEAIERAKADHVDLVRKIFGPDTSIQEALGAAIEELRVRFTYWNRRSRDTQGAVTTLAELKLREKQVVAAARGIDQEIVKVQAELDQINEKKGALLAKQGEAERTLARKRAIQLILGQPPIDPRTIEKVKADLAALPPSTLPQGLEQSRAILRAGDETIVKVQSQIHHQEKVISAAEVKLVELVGLQCCPWCRSNEEGWREALGDELRETIEKATAAKTEGETLLAGLTSGRASLDKSISETALTTEKRIQLSAELVRLERKLEEDEKNRTKLVAELAELELLPVAEDLGHELTGLGAESSAVRLKLEGLRKTKDAETRLQQQLVSAAQAELEHQDAAAHVVVIRAVAGLLKDKREAMIEEAFSGLLEVANKMTSGILKHDLCLHENTIGMWDGGKFIPHRVFSGTEKALAYIAVSVALSSTAPLKLVILDEFGRLDEDNQGRVIDRLSELVEDGVIDQFIIVGTGLPAPLPGPMHVIKV